MVYVDDPLKTFREFRRILKPGGKAHAIDGDFAMVAIDPVPPQTGGILDAASRFARRIGRKLYGARSGFSSVDVKIMAAMTPKDASTLRQNIAGYAGESAPLTSRIRQILDTAHAALEDGTYFAVNPQFVVTATV